MTLRIGIIGCGAVAEFHLRAIRQHPDCVAVACADVNREAALGRADQFGIPQVFFDAESLLDCREVDVAVICTPPKWHAAQFVAAVERGKHVLVEKPAACTLSEADAMIAAAARANRIVGVALMHRYMPAYQAAREMIQAGLFGTLRRVSLSLGTNMYGDSRFASPQADRRAWLVDCNVAGGGILMSSSIHFLSVVSYLLGDPVATHVCGRVRQLHPAAFEQIEDDVDIRVSWDNDVDQVLRESWMKDIPYRTEVIGDSGRVMITGNDHLHLSIHGEFTRPLPAQFATLLRDHADTVSRPVDPAEPLFFALWADFVESIRQRSLVAQLPSLRHARNMQAVVAAAYQAEKTGQACPVDWLFETRRALAMIP